MKPLLILLAGVLLLAWTVPDPLPGIGGPSRAPYVDAVTFSTDATSDTVLSAPNLRLTIYWTGSANPDTLRVYAIGTSARNRVVGLYSVTRDTVLTQFIRRSDSSETFYLMTLEQGERLFVSHPVKTYKPANSAATLEWR